MEMLETVEFDHGSYTVASMMIFWSIFKYNFLVIELMCESYYSLKF